MASTVAGVRVQSNLDSIKDGIVMDVVDAMGALPDLGALHVGNFSDGMFFRGKTSLVYAGALPLVLEKSGNYTLIVYTTEDKLFGWVYFGPLTTTKRIMQLCAEWGGAVHWGDYCIHYPCCGWSVHVLKEIFR
jgi:hypothetical protein